MWHVFHLHRAHLCIELYHAITTIAGNAWFVTSRYSPGHLVSERDEPWIIVISGEYQSMMSRGLPHQWIVSEHEETWITSSVDSIRAWGDVDYLISGYYQSMRRRGLPHQWIVSEHEETWITSSVDSIRAWWAVDYFISG